MLSTWLAAVAACIPTATCLHIDSCQVSTDAWQMHVVQIRMAMTTVSADNLNELFELCNTRSKLAFDACILAGKLDGSLIGLSARVGEKRLVSKRALIH